MNEKETLSEAGQFLFNSKNFILIGEDSEGNFRCFTIGEDSDIMKSIKEIKNTDKEIEFILKR